MRSALFTITALFVLVAIRSGAQINPGQIARLQRACTPPGSPYSPDTNTCVTTSGTGLPINNPQFTGNLHGPTVTSSENTPINVMAPPYNAKGDCMTDDHDAIVAAQTAAMAYAYQAALYFPKPPGGCYLLSTLDWQGESLIGQPGGSGNTVTLRGRPGQDVIHIKDPTTNNYQYQKTWTIENFTIQVDNSVAGNFLHRWPGRWNEDSSMTAGSAVLKSTRTPFAPLGCADIGQAIKVGGAGPGGTDLVTTVASVAPCWENAGPAWVTVTLADPASTTVSNAHTYVSLLNLPVTAHIGNCGIAWDDLDGNPANWLRPSFQGGSLNDNLWNVWISATNGQTNDVCGIYTQGLWGFYGIDARNFTFRQLVYGIVQGTAELNSWYESSSNDFQTWDHGSLEQVKNPWISYNGGYNKLNAIELTSENGPQILGSPNKWADAVGGWVINVPEHEFELGLGWTVIGKGMTFLNNSFGGAKAKIYTLASRCIDCIAGNMDIGGWQNKFDFAEDLSLGTVNDQGFGNLITFRYSTNPLNGMPLNEERQLNKYKPVDRIGAMGSDFIFDGNYSTAYNHDDLMLWPKDQLQNNGGATGRWEQFYADDSSSPTGGYMIIRPGHGMGGWQQFTPAGQLIVGKHVPAGKITLAFLAKCPEGTTTFTMSAGTHGGAHGYNLFASKAFTGCTTSYQVYSFVADLAPYSGEAFLFDTADNTIYVAWIALRPFSEVTATKLISGTANNTDLTGRITLTATTTGSYTFTGTGYRNVNCFWQPRFNIGTTSWWDTTTGATASVTTSAAVTGTFAYHCIAQN